jgi:hypothetical protein
MNTPTTPPEPATPLELAAAWEELAAAMSDCAMGMDDVRSAENLRGQAVARIECATALRNLTTDQEKPCSPA